MSEVKNIPAWTWFYGEDLMKREAFIESGMDYKHRRVLLLASNSATWMKCGCPDVIIPREEVFSGAHLFLFTGFLPQYGTTASVQRFDLSRYWSDQAESGYERVGFGNLSLVMTHNSATENKPYVARGDLEFSPRIDSDSFRGFWSSHPCDAQLAYLYAIGIPNDGTRVTILIFDQYLNPEYRTIRSTPEGLFMER